LRYTDADVSGVAFTPAETVGDSPYSLRSVRRVHVNEKFKYAGLAPRDVGYGRLAKGVPEPKKKTSPKARMLELQRTYTLMSGKRAWH
jgi:hypothetical protein